MAKTPAEIRELRALHPKMRERDFARIHGISEAELTAAYVGESVTRLNVNVATLLNGLTACGEVMALTRNESAVHEKIGPYEDVKVGASNALVLGDDGFSLGVFFRGDRAPAAAPLKPEISVADIEREFAL